MMARVGSWLWAVTIACTAALAVVVPSAQARPHISSPTHSFGELRAEQAAIVGVQVTAVDEPTTIESVEMLDPSSPFWIESEDCIGDPMGVNDVCHVAVVFLAPDADGSFQDTLRIQAEDGTAATSVVQGSSYRAGGLTADPARVDWDRLSFGVRTVVLRNRATEALWIDSVAATPGFSVRNRTFGGFGRALAGRYVLRVGVYVNVTYQPLGGRVDHSACRGLWGLPRAFWSDPSVRGPFGATESGTLDISAETCAVEADSTGLRCGQG